MMKKLSVLKTLKIYIKKDPIWKMMQNVNGWEYELIIILGIKI